MLTGIRFNPHTLTESHSELNMVTNYNTLIQVFLLSPAHPRYGMMTCLPRTKDRTNWPLPPHQKQNIDAEENRVFMNAHFYKLKLQHLTCEQ